MHEHRNPQQEAFTLAAVMIGLVALALSPLGFAAGTVTLLACFAVVQLTGMRWWWPLVLAVLGGLILSLRWEGAMEDLNWSRARQLYEAFHPNAPGSDWGAHWRSWTVATLAFAIPAGALAAGIICGLRERDHPRARRERRPRVGWLRLLRVRRRARTQSDRSLERRGLILGVDERGRTVRVEDAELAGHTLVVGATGSGKTTTLRVILAAAIRKGHPVCAVDLKGDPALVGQLRSAAHRAGRPFTAWSIDGRASWNPLAYGNATELKDKLIGLEEWTEPHYRRAAERYLQVLFSVLEHEGHTPDLDRVVELMAPAALNRALRHLPEPDAERIAAYLDGLTADQISAIRGLANRLAVITESVAGVALRNDAGQPTIDLRHTLTHGGVVVFSLNASTYGELAAHLGALVIQDLKTTAGALLHRPGALPAYVAVDEFSALGADHMLALLARARSAGIRVLLCTQELADLERAAEGFRDQVLGNTATKIAHRQEVPASADTLASVAGTRQTWHRTHQTHSVFGAGMAEDTGIGTKRLVDEYVVHPNTLKTLRTGEAVLIRKHPRPDVRVLCVVAPDDDQSEGRCRDG
jgi:energy-coupling factor transporter ATP-binding protein EcfA2